MIKASAFYSIPKRHLSVCFQDRNMFHLMNGINYAVFNCLEKSFQVHLSLSVCEDLVPSLAMPQNKLQLVMAWINIMIPYLNYGLGNTEGYKIHIQLKWQLSSSALPSNCQIHHGRHFIKPQTIYGMQTFAIKLSVPRCH